MLKYPLIVVVLMTTSLIARAQADNGQQIYQTCAPCHGNAAEGNQSQFAPPLAGQDSAYLQEQLINFREGYRGTHTEDVFGRIMSASAAPLNDEEVMAVAGYLENLPSQSVPASKQGNIANGEQIFENSCAACHGHKAHGISSVHAPNLTMLGDWYLESQIKAYKSGWRGHGESTARAKGMRSIAEQLTNYQDVADVIAWITSLE